MQQSTENGDKHCHFFLQNMPTYSENETWFTGRGEISNIYHALWCNWYLEMEDDEVRDRD